MYLGRVTGRVWATTKNASMDGQRLLVVQPLTPHLQTTGKRLICMDVTGAGAGELVYWVRGKEASFPFAPAEPCIDTTIVGIVDTVHLRERGQQPPSAPDAATSSGGAAIQLSPPAVGAPAPSRPAASPPAKNQRGRAPR